MSSALQLLLVVLVAVSQVECSGGFEEGKVYYYHYESRVGTGVSDASAKQFSGRGFQAEIAVQLVGSKLTFSLAELNFAKFNQKLNMDNLFDKLNLEYYRANESPSDAEKHLYSRISQKLFWADYDNGEIHAVYFPEGLNQGMINFLKAIIALFQTNFKPLVHEGSHLYKLYEDGIGGDCNTLYHVAHHPEDDHPEEHVLNVTKVRFYDECKHRPHLLYSSVFGVKCQTCELKEFKAVKNLGRVDYKIKGTKDKYTIEQIDGTGVITFSPFSTNGQTVISVVNQTLSLYQVSARSSFSLPAKFTKEENLHYEYNNDHDHDHDHEHHEVDLEKHHYHDRYHDEPYAAASKEAYKELSDYISHIKSDLNGFDENAKNVANIIRSLRVLKYSDIEGIFQKHVKPYEHKDGENTDSSTADEQDVRSLLHRILPLVGTNPAIKYMLDEIKEQHMSPVSAINAISTFPFHVKEPSAKLLEYVKSFPDNHHYAGVNDALQLALGTLVFRSCVKDDFNSHPAHAQTYVDDATCKKVVEEMIAKYQGAQSPTSNTYLRAIVNTRHESSFKFLASILSSHSVDYQHRLLTVWGLFNFIEKKQEQLGVLFAPIFYDPDEDHEIRCYAFEGMLFSRPSAEFFSSLVFVLNKEPNDKVANYVYLTLSAYANSSDPCMEPFKHQIRQTLAYARPRFRDVAMHGSNRMFSFFNPEFNYGRTMHFVTIPDNSSFIPRDIYFRQSVNVMGYNFDIVEMGTVGVMPDYAIGELKELLGKYGLSPNRDHGTVETKATKQENWQKHPEANYDIYYRHGGQFMQSDDVQALVQNIEPLILEVLTDQGDVASLTKKAGSPAGVTIRANKIKYVEVEYSIPNEMGLPVVISLYAPVTAKISGLVKGGKNQDGTLELHTDLKVGFAAYVKAGLYVNTLAFGKFGYGVKTDLVFKMPFKRDIAWNRAERRFESIYEPSAEPYDVFHYHTVPQTFNDEDHLPITYAEKPTQRVYHVGHKYLGVGLTFNFTYDYKWNNYGSYRTFFKSFFKKASSYEEYFQLADKWFAGSRNFANYAIFNPTGKPFHLEVEFSRCSTHPTAKFHTTIKRKIDSKPDADSNMKRQLEVEIEATGAVERKWTVAFGLQYNHPYRDHRVLQFRFKRSALPNYDSNPFEFCYKSNRQIHDLASIFSGKGKKNVKWEYDGELNIGENCVATRQVKIKGLGEKSEEQLSLVKEQLPIYKKCKQDTAKGYEYSYACWLVKKDLGRLDKFTFDVQYKNVPDYVRSYAFRLYGWFRHTFYNNLEIDHFEGNKDPNHVQITANFSYFDPILDVKVVRDKQTVFYHDVFVPSVVPRFEPITVTEPAADRYLRRIVRYHKPMCILSGDYVRSLDKVEYKAKISSCYHVAFADFITQNTAVYVAHDGDDKHKKVKVQLTHDVVEITNAGNDLSVTVNGEKKTITEKPTYITLKDLPDSEITIFKYFKGVVVKSPAHDIGVFTDGKNVKINPSPLLRGNPTGLCGNYDGDSGYEFVNQYGVEFHSADKFVEQFKTSSC